MSETTELQKLVVQLEASFVKYDRAWSKAMGQTDTNVKQVQQRFDRMSGAVANAGASSAQGLRPLQMQTGNVAAQFQDIAVQLSQPGTSPFLIAMQQGTQLSAVLSQSKSPIAALSAGFMQMVNPISLATIALIALGGTAVQYLTSLLGDGKSATEVIKEQNETIRRVAENWGDAVPQLKAYVDQLDRAAKTADLNAAYDALVSNAYAGLRAQIPELRAHLADARRDIEGFGGTAQEIDALQWAFDELRAKVENGKVESADLDRVLMQLAQTSGATTVPSLVSLQGILQGVAGALASAAREASAANAELARLKNTRPGMDLKERFGTSQFIEEQERINGLTAEQLSLETEIARVKSEADRADTLISDQQALEIARGRLSAEQRRSEIAQVERGAGREADREREAVLQLIEELQHEFDLLGLTQEQKSIANALRRAGAAATEEERQAIIALVSATEEERSRITQVQEAYAEMGRIGETAVRGIIDALADGKIEASELKDILASIGNQLINAGLNTLFGGGGLFNFGGARAGGGPVQGGRTYLVGEKGPELFTAPSAGKIVAHDKFGGGTMSFPFAPTITVQDGSAESLARVERVVRKMAAEHEGRTKQIVRDYRNKWR